MQRLNLYSQLERAVEPLFSARQQAWAVASVAVVMLLVFGLLAMGEQSRQAELQRVQRQQSDMLDNLERLRLEKARQLRNSRVDEEIAALTRQISFRRRLLVSVIPDDDEDKTGFTSHLEGLARQHIDGVWFTSIELLNGGSQLSIAGQTTSPELVPRFIQRLSEEEIFNGHQFSIFKLYVPEDEDQLLNFELRADMTAAQSIAANRRGG